MYMLTKILNQDNLKMQMISALKYKVAAKRKYFRYELTYHKAITNETNTELKA